MKKLIILFLILPCLAYSQVIYFDGATGTVPVSATYPLPVTVDSSLARGTVKVSNFPDSAVSRSTLKISNFPDSALSRGTIKISNFPDSSLSRSTLKISNSPDSSLSRGTIQVSNIPDSTTSRAYLNLLALPNIMQQPDTALIWASDTLAVAGKIDTLSKFAYYTLTNLGTMFKVRYQLTITADSTIMASTSPSFTDGLTFTVNSGESYTTNYLSPSAFPMLYVKMGSSITGVTTWRADIHGF